MLATGALWVLMPCGLLYSALLVAALSGGPLEGALAMALFALGSGAVAGCGAVAVSRLRRLATVRGTGAPASPAVLLAAAAGWALWMDLVYKPSLWCR